MHRGTQVVLEEALSRAGELPVPRRILLYTGLAELCGDPQLCAEFYEAASTLAAADARCRELALVFDRQHKAHP